MSTATIQVEIPCVHPAEKVFKAFCDFDTIAPKVNPAVFKSIKTIEGNGDVGTIRDITFGDGVSFSSGKNKVDVYDPSNFTYGNTFFEGDYLRGTDSITHLIKIVPSADGGSVYKQTITYNCKGNDKPSEEVLNSEKSDHETTFKAMEAYAAAHPELY
ncbi:root allergen protein-like protein [Tanacetum coccineum]